MSAGTAGTLASGEWDWADNDALGFTTIYVRLSDDTDPDSKADGYVQAEYTNFSVDTTTGVVTFNSPPADGADVRATFEFDVPVRFDVDELQLQARLHDVASAPNVPVVETRDFT